MKKIHFRAGFLLLVLSFLTIGIFGQSAPAPRTIRLQTVVSGLSSPVFVTHAKDGSRRLFVVQQGGIIKVVQPGTNTATDFLNITPKVRFSGEQGLLGLAFHPQFATNGYFFVNYTRQPDGATVIARYKATNNNMVGDANSEVVLLTIDQPYSNHNGGMIEFRSDNGVNNLYIGMGDGGSANDPQNNAQNINSLLGKFLRITPSVAATPPTPAYTIPADNPYVGVNGADEIYAVGLRNPFRWSFDRANPSQLWAGDVGQDRFEEVDLITRGGNFGWRVYEGTQCTGIDAALCVPANYIAPVTQYEHLSGRCSITGGYVYRGGLGTLPNGAYLYGDYCTGEVFLYSNNQQSLLLDWTNFNLPSFGEDEDGELYLVGISSGTIVKLVRAKANADFDGDLKTDVSVFRPSAGAWYILNSFNNSFRGQPFGANGDIPAPEDYDGDNITDIGVYRPSNGGWYYLRSSDSTFVGFQFQFTGSIPVAGDYDGDAKADIAVFHPSGGAWYRRNSTNNQLIIAAFFGRDTDIPVPSDYDGDGKTDIAVFRPSGGLWFRLNSTNGAFAAVTFGAETDVPVPADYDGDGKSDVAVFRPSNGSWYRLNSTNGAFAGLAFGANGDVPVPGDYDGDGTDDIAVFRPSNGSWYLQRSTSGFTGVVFGQNGDLPIPKYDAP